MSTVAAQFWRDNADLVETASRNPFVRGIADGTLDRDAYAAYLAQDAIFLDAFARAYGLALARCPDRAGVEAFAELISGVRDELRLHDMVTVRWGIDMSTVEASPATLAYTEFLLATAATGDTGTTCAAMTPCMRLYAHLGQSLNGVSEESYREWVEAYASPEFERLAASMEELLDRYVGDVTLAGRVYRRAMRLEVAFFDAAAAGQHPLT